MIPEEHVAWRVLGLLIAGLSGAVVGLGLGVLVGIVISR